MMKKILLAGACLFAAAPMTLSAQLAYENFSSIGGLMPVGSATQEKGILRLTPDRAWSVGGIWSAEKQQVESGFSTEFTFRMTGTGGAKGEPNGDGGADGLAFVIQNSSPAVLGEIGHQIGYGGIPNSLAIEIDTWNNAAMGNGDPNNNHISIQTAGLAANSYDHKFSLGATGDIPRLDDGRAHTLGVDYADGRMTISIDGNEVLDVELDLAATLNLDAGRAWVGFTSATACAWENHDLLSWSFSAPAKKVEEAIPAISENEAGQTSGSLARSNAVTGTPALLAARLMPNPASATTTLAYTLPVDRNLVIALVDLEGTLVSTLFEGEQAAGAQDLQIETGELAAGSYTVVIRADDGQALSSTRLVVVR